MLCMRGVADIFMGLMVREDLLAFGWLCRVLRFRQNADSSFFFLDLIDYGLRASWTVLPLLTYFEAT